MKPVGWKLGRKNVVYRQQRFRVVEQEVTLPSGRRSVWSIVDVPDFVAVLALTKDREVAVIREFRAAYGKVVTSLPTGDCEEAEDPAVSAARELEEETGYTAGTITPLGAFCPFAGISAVKTHLFLATGLVGGQAKPNEMESIEVGVIPLADAFAQVERNENPFAAFALALLLARHKGLL